MLVYNHLILQLTMVIQETTRLYPAAPILQRQAMQDLKVGNLVIPKDTVVLISLPALHQDPAMWGQDAMEFKPERFINGVSAACKVPQIYVPFGFGDRVCLGQAFAMAEMKLAISMILSKFSFSLSPSYRHSPAFRITLEPGDGLNVFLARIWQYYYLCAPSEYILLPNNWFYNFKNCKSNISDFKMVYSIFGLSRFKPGWTVF